MRLSPQRHTLAVLRSVIGISQKEMASLLECSTPTIQAIELGKLKISINLAERVFVQTGVSIEWLLADNVTKLPATDAGEPYTKALFEKRQAGLLSPKDSGTDVLFDLWRTLWLFIKTTKLLAILYTEAYKRGKAPLLFYKTVMPMKQICEEMLGENKAIEAKLAGLRYHELGPVSLFELDETLDDLWADTREELERKLKLAKEPLPKHLRDYFVDFRQPRRRSPKKKTKATPSKQ